MIRKKEDWIKEASYKLALLLEFEEHFLVPDGKTLNVFLKRPTLIIKMMYKDIPDMCQEALDSYEDFEKNRKHTFQLVEEDIKKLEESYNKGLTPSDAAIEMIKWCNTPEEAGKFLVSPETHFLPIIMMFGLFLGLIAIIITLYGVTKDRVNVQYETENVSTLYKNVTKLYQEKGDFKLNTVIAFKDRAIPETLPIVNNKLMNRWDGEVTLLGSGVNNFEVTYTHVKNRETCIMFVKKQKETGWTSVKVGNDTFENISQIKDYHLVKSCDVAEYIPITFKK